MDKKPDPSDKHKYAPPCLPISEPIALKPTVGLTPHPTLTPLPIPIPIPILFAIAQRNTTARIVTCEITAATSIDRDDVEGHPNGFCLHINDGSPTIAALTTLASYHVGMRERATRAAACAFGIVL